MTDNPKVEIRRDKRIDHLMIGLDGASLTGVQITPEIALMAIEVLAQYVKESLIKDVEA